MLNPTASDALRAGVRGRIRIRPGLALRMALMVASVAYVAGPTVVQWVSLDQARTETAALREAPIQAPSFALSAGQDPSSSGAAAAEEYARMLGSGVVAVGEMPMGSGTLVDDLGALGVRTGQAFVVLFGAFALAMRMTVRYRPRHAGGAGFRMLARRR